jgi:hypothetical protein
MTEEDLDIREVRLQSEFEHMLALREPDGSIDFRCASLSRKEGLAVTSRVAPADVLARGMAEFMTVEEFRSRHPRRAPEKYLIALRCWGVARSGDVKRMLGIDASMSSLPQPFTDDGLIVIDDHRFEAIFPYQYPESPPLFVWLTPIFHPNIRDHYLCTTGRPFASGIRLGDVCRMVTRMVQYRNFNPDSYLDAAAREWALTQRRCGRLPVDARVRDTPAGGQGLILVVDGNAPPGPESASGDAGETALVEWI